MPSIMYSLVEEIIQMVLDWFLDAITISDDTVTLDHRRVYLPWNISCEDEENGIKRREPREGTEIAQLPSSKRSNSISLGIRTDISFSFSFFLFTDAPVAYVSSLDMDLIGAAAEATDTTILDLSHSCNLHHSL